MKQYACLAALVATVTSAAAATAVAPGQENETPAAKGNAKGATKNTGRLLGKSPPRVATKGASTAVENVKRVPEPSEKENDDSSIKVKRIAGPGEPMPTVAPNHYVGRVEAVRMAGDGSQLVTMRIMNPGGNKDPRNSRGADGKEPMYAPPDLWRHVDDDEGFNMMGHFGAHMMPHGPMGAHFCPGLAGMIPSMGGMAMGPMMMGGMHPMGGNRHRMPMGAMNAMGRGPMAMLLEQMGTDKRTGPPPMQLSHIGDEDVAEGKFPDLPESMKETFEAKEPTCVVVLSYDGAAVPSIGAVRLEAFPERNVLTATTSVQEVRPGVLSMSTINLELLTPEYCVLSPEVIEAAIEAHKVREAEDAAIEEAKKHRHVEKEQLSELTVDGVPRAKRIYMSFPVDRSKLPAKEPATEEPKAAVEEQSAKDPETPIAQAIAA